MMVRISTLQLVVVLCLLIVAVIPVLATHTGKWAWSGSLASARRGLESSVLAGGGGRSDVDAIKKSSGTSNKYGEIMINGELSSTSTPSSVSTARARLLQRFIHLRIGGGSSDGLQKHPQAIWHYHGCLRSPFTGKVLADVEGLEYIKLIETASPTTAIQSARIKFWPPGPKSTDDGIRQARFLSKKVFFYLDTNKNSSSLPQVSSGSGSGNQQLLRTFKLSPISRSRQVNPIKQYYELVSVGINENSTLADAEFISTCWFPRNQRQLHNHQLSMYPANGRDAGSRSNWDESALEVSNFMRYAPTSKLDANRNSTSSFWGRLATTKWISFGQPFIGGRSQEHYTLQGAAGPRKDTLFSWWYPRKGTVEASLKYQRIGDAPSWVSSRSVCSVELKGERYASEEDLPHSIVHLVRSYRPEFLGAAAQMSLSEFNEAADMLDEYVPWYERLRNYLLPTRRERVDISLRAF
jgi:hypothetical protein